MKNPRPVCPNTACLNHTDPPRGFYRKNGYRRAAHNHQPIPRYQCKTCGKNFCATQTKPIRQHHRPDLNAQVFKLAVSGVTMRRMVSILGCSKRTIARKITHLARETQKHHAAFLADPANRTAYVMMDELETFIHARHQQVSVPVIIRVKTDQILGFAVCRITSTMTLGGAGVNPLPPGGTQWVHHDRETMVPGLLKAVKPLLKDPATIATDGDGSYPKWIKKDLPGVTHLIHHSPKETNLGRAKKRADGAPREHDPLFAINVIHAKMRNDLARLGRKTWTTTKSVQGLRNHLWLYVAWTNKYPIR